MNRFTDLIVYWQELIIDLGECEYAFDSADCALFIFFKCANTLFRRLLKNIQNRYTSRYTACWWSVYVAITNIYWTKNIYKNDAHRHDHGFQWQNLRTNCSKRLNIGKVEWRRKVNNMCDQRIILRSRLRVRVVKTQQIAKKYGIYLKSFERNLICCTAFKKYVQKIEWNCS